MIEHKNNSSMLQNVLASTIRWLFRLKTKGTNNAYLACRDFIDHQFYARQADDLWKTAGDMSLHYHLLGWKRGLDPHPLFATSWYLARYGDVRREKINPFAHYLIHGGREHRDPSPAFNTAWYAQRYTDVRINPLAHFIKHGRSEGRSPQPPAVLSDLEEDTFVAIHTLNEHATPERRLLALSDFDANDALVRIDGQRWRSLGRDPQLTHEGNVEAGFLRVRLRATYHNMRSPAAREAIVELFFDQGKGISQVDAFTFALDGETVDIDALLLLESDATLVRLDPINTECEIDLELCEFSRVAFDDAIRELYASYCWDGDRPLHSEREFFDQIQWANISRFVRQQTGAIDHRADPYRRWIEARRLTPSILRRQSSVGAARETPLFSILMPTYKSDLSFLKKAIDSVRAQTYRHWELCIVDDGSADDALHDFLERQAAKDPRTRYERLTENVGIANASNRALAMARGEFVALLDHDDELALHALSAMAAAIERTPNVDMLYSDEDKIDREGTRSGPLFKPDWSPEFFLSCMYTCHLGVYRRSLVEAVGGFRPAFDFAQDYDLAMRVSAKARAIVHVPDVLYHWRMLPTSTASGADAKPTAELAARRAVQDHVDAQGFDGHVMAGPIPGTHRVKLNLQGSPLVSIVIPTAARRLDPNVPRWYLLDLLRSIRERSTYPRYEIVLVENGDIEPALEEELRAFETVRVTYRAPVFNISEKMNLGVAAARGEAVVLLNDDMTIITPDWLEELIAWLQRPGIVGVGGKLLFPDDRVQHAGILLLAQGPSHVYYEAADVDAGLVGSAITHRNYAAVTGACLAVSKANYESVGGFDPSLRINYNDVDFCLRLGRIVYTAFAKLYHYESVSKGEVIASELGAFNERWADVLGMDPYYNINCSQSSPNAVTLRPLPLV
ncbi:Glycosyltransferase (modular protein) [Beijerinckiaceae bacterium RH AL1]|nr:glycosyltransferase [Beijerinckiaceae bacterium]VVB44524.1 Glycosyltransferase (modular protein) [Beijerinckiaceae bacterium RH CH11]VVB44604.1 Glycosyltransferase (modular protein) [Beijerinckiaceae bacterium RH AL8]VVC54402.1 Glycosyltransferase (modular protein) [Beijerinckiaceae bacterium RH AL1]